MRLLMGCNSPMEHWLVDFEFGMANFLIFSSAAGGWQVGGAVQMAGTALQQLWLCKLPLDGEALAQGMPQNDCGVRANPQLYTQLLCTIMLAAAAGEEVAFA